MGDFQHYVIPVIMISILIYGLLNRVNVFDTFIQGAREGLSVVKMIAPALVALMTAVGMFKVSGALDILTFALSPVARLLGLPQELMPLALLKPLSGSGGMAIFKEILTDHGPDSFIGRVASVMQGSTETTFYTIAVYFGSVGVRKTRHTLPASITADLIGFMMSAITVSLIM